MANMGTPDEETKKWFLILITFALVFIGTVYVFVLRNNSENTADQNTVIVHD